MNMIQYDLRNHILWIASMYINGKVQVWLIYAAEH